MVQTCYKLRKKILYKDNRQLAETVDCLARCYAMSGKSRINKIHLLKHCNAFFKQILGPDKQIFNVKMEIPRSQTAGQPMTPLAGPISYSSTKTHVVGTQKNRLDEMVLLSTQNTCLN